MRGDLKYIIFSPDSVPCLLFSIRLKHRWLTAGLCHAVRPPAGVQVWLPAVSRFDAKRCSFWCEMYAMLLGCQAVQNKHLKTHKQTQNKHQTTKTRHVIAFGVVDERHQVVVGPSLLATDGRHKSRWYRGPSVFRIHKHNLVVVFSFCINVYNCFFQVGIFLSFDLWSAPWPAANFGCQSPALKLVLNGDCEHSRSS